ncbi:ABC transporter ATP-binding protein [Anaerocolumna sp. AGMB13025]|uniref:ABC transporter ATP-binding protein n=1 Tax=Anaerocolumna sp. AGMB13025 TaxID=3039116 RepID=UPI00241D988A|nr:ABC transporter ATP-binding protein [Anaerocolumna sp. AGMB13025]WFR57616.1 ABC transporter ATP-binding protein [Anaerocolumna sp. AGMB13025]
MEDIIKVRNLKKYFNDIKAVDDISFQVEKGQLYGFLGVNGAGKSTTINILCTLFPKTEGEVTICGYQLGRDNDKIRSRIGVVFQENSLDNRLTIKENLTIRASLYNKDTKAIKKNLDSVCEILGIGELLNRQFRKLSGGQKRRCEIARALMNTPELLFLDEPTTGLDPQTRQQVWDSLEGLRREKHMTIFLTTHYMEEAAKAQYIAILEGGKLAAGGTPHTLKEKYANDFLRIYPKDKDKVIQYLKEKSCIYVERSNHIRINVANTKLGLALLNGIKEELSSCEILQGTMDDVFLNVTGKSL